MNVRGGRPQSNASLVTTAPFLQKPAADAPVRVIAAADPIAAYACG